MCTTSSWCYIRKHVKIVLKSFQVRSNQKWFLYNVTYVLCLCNCAYYLERHSAWWFHDPTLDLCSRVGPTPVGINRKGFVTSNFGMFLLLDYCIENERGSIGMPLCRVLINISSKSSKIVYFSQNCHFHVM